MPRRIDEIELVHLAGDGFECESDALRLDGDAPLALQVHGIEYLGLHFPGVEAPAFLDESIGQGRFAVVNMGDDRKVTYKLCFC